MDIQTILTAGRAVLTLLPMGGQAIVAGRAIGELIDANRGKLTASADEVAALDAARNELEAAVNAHADRTLSSLGANPLG